MQCKVHLLAIRVDLKSRYNVIRVVMIQGLSWNCSPTIVHLTAANLPLWTIVLLRYKRPFFRCRVTGDRQAVEVALSAHSLDIIYRNCAMSFLDFDDFKDGGERRSAQTPEMLCSIFRCIGLHCLSRDLLASTSQDCATMVRSLC